MSKDEKWLDVKRLARVDRRYGVLCVVSAALTFGCAAPPDETGRAAPDQAVSGADTTGVTSYLISTPSTRRLIPIRFVQFYATGGTPVSASTLQIRIDELNATFGAAGVQFYNRGLFSHPGTGFEVPATNNQYTWPATLSSNPPPWPVVDLSCPTAAYNQLLASLPGGASGSRSDPRGKDIPWDGALWRGPVFCAANGEIVVYVVDNRGANQATIPGAGNAIIVVAADLSVPLNPGTSAIVHEMSHYIGGLADVSTVPASGLGAEYWDLVYRSTDGSVFNSMQDAQAWIAGGGGLGKIEGADGSQAHGLNVRFCRSGSPPVQPGCPPPISCGPTLDNTGALAVTIGATTYHSGDPQIRGLAGLSGSTRYVNTSAYSDWCYRNPTPSTLKDYLSPSGVEHVTAVMTKSADDPLTSSSAFSGLTSRRSKLGEGMWTSWTAMPSGAYVASRPGVEITPANPGHFYVTWRNAPPLSGGGILAADCTATQTGGCTVENASVGSQAYQGPPDITLAGTGSQITTHVMAWASGSAEPLFRGRLTSGGSWSPSSDWVRPGGGFLDAPSITGRANGQMDAVGRGLDSGAYIGTLNADGSWPAGTWWQSMGTTISGPMSIGTRFSDGMTIDVVTRQDGNILHRSRDASGSWTLWTTLFTGTTVSEPSLSERADGLVDVVAMVDGNVCFKTFAWGSWWSGPCVPTSGTILGDPTLSIVGNPSFAAWEAGRGDMVARASDGSVVYRFINKQTGDWWPGPTQWAKFGGGAASGSIGDPIIVATGVDNFAIVSVDGNGNIYYRVRYQ